MVRMAYQDLLCVSDEHEGSDFENGELERRMERPGKGKGSMPPPPPRPPLRRTQPPVPAPPPQQNQSTAPLSTPGIPSTSNPGQRGNSPTNLLSAGSSPKPATGASQAKGTKRDRPRRASAFQGSYGSGSGSDKESSPDVNDGTDRAKRQRLGTEKKQKATKGKKVTKKLPPIATTLGQSPKAKNSNPNTLDLTSGRRDANVDFPTLSRLPTDLTSFPFDPSVAERFLGNSGSSSPPRSRGRESFTDLLSNPNIAVPPFSDSLAGASPSAGGRSTSTRRGGASDQLRPSRSPPPPGSPQISLNTGSGNPTLGQSSIRRGRSGSPSELEGFGIEMGWLPPPGSRQRRSGDSNTPPQSGRSTAAAKAGTRPQKQKPIPPKQIEPLGRFLDTLPVLPSSSRHGLQNPTAARSENSPPGSPPIFPPNNQMGPVASLNYHYLVESMGTPNFMDSPKTKKTYSKSTFQKALRDDPLMKHNFLPLSPSPTRSNSPRQASPRYVTNERPPKDPMHQNYVPFHDYPTTKRLASDLAKEESPPTSPQNIQEPVANNPPLQRQNSWESIRQVGSSQAGLSPGARVPAGRNSPSLQPGNLQGLMSAKSPQQRQNSGSPREGGELNQGGLSRLGSGSIPGSLSGLGSPLGGLSPLGLEFLPEPTASFWPPDREKSPSPRRDQGPVIDLRSGSESRSPSPIPGRSNQESPGAPQGRNSPTPRGRSPSPRINPQAVSNVGRASPARSPSLPALEFDPTDMDFLLGRRAASQRSPSPKANQEPAPNLGRASPTRSPSLPALEFNPMDMNFMLGENAAFQRSSSPSNIQASPAPVEPNLNLAPAPAAQPRNAPSQRSSSPGNTQTLSDPIQPNPNPAPASATRSRRSRVPVPRYFRDNPPGTRGTSPPPTETEGWKNEQGQRVSTVLNGFTDLEFPPAPEGQFVQTLQAGPGKVKMQAHYAYMGEGSTGRGMRGSVLSKLHTVTSDKSIDFSVRTTGGSQVTRAVGQHLKAHAIVNSGRAKLEGDGQSVELTSGEHSLTSQSDIHVAAAGDTSLVIAASSKPFGPEEGWKERWHQRP